MFKAVFVGDESDIYAYKREFGNESVFIVLNNSGKQQAVGLRIPENIELFDIYNEKN